MDGLLSAEEITERILDIIANVGTPPRRHESHNDDRLLRGLTTAAELSNRANTALSNASMSEFKANIYDTNRQ